MKIKTLQEIRDNFPSIRKALKRMKFQFKTSNKQFPKMEITITIKNKKYIVFIDNKNNFTREMSYDTKKEALEDILDTAKTFGLKEKNLISVCPNFDLEENLKIDESGREISLESLKEITIIDQGDSKVAYTKDMKRRLLGGHWFEKIEKTSYGYNIVRRPYGGGGFYRIAFAKDMKTVLFGGVEFKTLKKNFYGYEFPKDFSEEFYAFAEDMKTRLFLEYSFKEIRKTKDGYNLIQSNGNIIPFEKDRKTIKGVRNIIYNISIDFNHFMDQELIDKLREQLILIVPFIIKELGYKVVPRGCMVPSFLSFLFSSNKKLNQKEKNKIIEKLNEIEFEGENISFELNNYN